MPTGLVKKLAKKHGMSTKQAEEKWDDAKEATKKSGWGATTKVFKNMMHEKGSSRLKRALARLKSQ